MLIAQEPLAPQQIAHIIEQRNDRIRASITQLGGLLTLAGQQEYTLFHPKLNEYLRQDEGELLTEIQFDAEEVQNLHDQIANWCNQGPIEQLWQPVFDPTPRDDYQEYAQKYYLLHLYEARTYDRLFEVLHAGAYEQGKLRFDPSTRSTAGDLLFGCQAAAHKATTLSQGEELLTYLWRYTVLRTNLTTQADAYPLEAFQALLARGKEDEAFNLAELLTRSTQQLDILILLDVLLAGLALFGHGYA